MSNKLPGLAALVQAENDGRIKSPDDLGRRAQHFEALPPPPRRKPRRARPGDRRPPQRAVLVIAFLCIGAAIVLSVLFGQ